MPIKKFRGRDKSYEKIERVGSIWVDWVMIDAAQ